MKMTIFIGPKCMTGERRIWLAQYSLREHVPEGKSTNELMYCDGIYRLGLATALSLHDIMICMTSL